MIAMGQAAWREGRETAKPVIISGFMRGILTAFRAWRPGSEKLIEGLFAAISSTKSSLAKATFRGSDAAH